MAKEPTRGWCCVEMVSMTIVPAKKYSYRWFKQKIRNLLHQEGEEKTNG